MNDYDFKAAQLQGAVRADEYSEAREYTVGDVRRAAVHSRQDIVLLVSHLSSLNAQAATIRRCLIFLSVVMTVVAVRLFG